MNLKPTLIICCLFFITRSAFAQVEIQVPYFQKLYTSKNRILYGGSISFQSPVSDLKVLHIGIQPQFGGFVTNNFAILGILHGSYGTNGEPARFMVNAGGGVELRYYIGNSFSKFYIHGNAIPHYVHYNYPDFGIMAGGGPGMAFFTGPKFSINVALYAGVYRMVSSYFNQPVFSFNIVLNGLFTTVKNRNENDLLNNEDF